jgi:branched-chain amino acid transport system ATP-binding protein
MLEVNGITVTFGGVKPLDDVSLMFEERVCGLIGPNGAGKTTLFNVLSGFVAPRRGSATIDGRDLLRMSARRRAQWGLRRTFQQEQVIDALTVAENLKVASEHSRRNRHGNAADEVLDAVRLDVELEQPAAHLSPRERRLLEIGRALIGAPRVVLLDEPGAGLDEAETEDLAVVIRGLPERFGVQVLLVDHDMDLVEATCNTLAVLDFGRVIAAGPCSQVLEDEAVKRAYLGVEEPV